MAATKRGKGWRGGRRTVATRPIQMTRHLVVSEGTETERRYFEGMRNALGAVNGRKVAVAAAPCIDSMSAFGDLDHGVGRGDPLREEAFMICMGCIRCYPRVEKLRASLGLTQSNSKGCLAYLVPLCADGSGVLCNRA